MKLHLIGGSGTGKTHLAEALSAAYGIPHIDLDELQWDDRAGTYGVRRDPAERQAMLDDILRRDDWIIEGVYYTWCGQCFADADRIYLLQTPRRVWRYRLLRRFVRRKLGLEKGKRETLRSLLALLRWADGWQRDSMPEIRALLAPYADKLIELPYGLGPGR